MQDADSFVRPPLKGDVPQQDHNAPPQAHGRTRRRQLPQLYLVRHGLVARAASQRKEHILLDLSLCKADRAGHEIETATLRAAVEEVAR